MSSSLESNYHTHLVVAGKGSSICCRVGCCRLYLGDAPAKANTLVVVVMQAMRVVATTGSTSNCSSSSHKSLAAIGNINLCSHHQCYLLKYLLHHFSPFHSQPVLYD